MYLFQNGRTPERRSFKQYAFLFLGPGFRYWFLAVAIDACHWMKANGVMAEYRWVGLFFWRAAGDVKPVTESLGSSKHFPGFWGQWSAMMQVATSSGRPLELGAHLKYCASPPIRPGTCLQGNSKLE